MFFSWRYYKLSKVYNQVLLQSLQIVEGLVKSSYLKDTQVTQGLIKRRTPRLPNCMRYLCIVFWDNLFEIYNNWISINSYFTAIKRSSIV